MITIFVPSDTPITPTIYKKILYCISLSKLKCTCAAIGQFIFYGTYHRFIKNDYSKYRLQICRIKCKNCCHTHAILLSTLVPYSQHPLIEYIYTIDFFEKRITSNVYNKPSIKCMLDKIKTMDDNDMHHIYRQYRRYWRKHILEMSKGSKSNPTSKQRCNTPSSSVSKHSHREETVSTVGNPFFPIEALVKKCFDAYSMQFMQIRSTPNILFMDSG